jgi:hypothetical protein
MHVLVTGASGSGTTTLGQALAHRWSAHFLDADSYFWLPTSTPYSQRRAPQERDSLFLQALHEQSCSVAAGSVMGWGAAIEDAFSIIIFLYVPTEVRLRRLEAREVQRYGKANPAFLAWAAQYDSGPPEGRSMSKHNAWLSQRRCPVVRLSGDASIESLVSEVENRAPRLVSRLFA